MRYYLHTSCREFYRVYPDGTYEWYFAPLEEYRKDGTSFKWMPSLETWDERWAPVEKPCIKEITKAQLFQALL